MGKIDKKKLKLIATIFSEYGWFLFSRKLIVEHIKESNSDSAEALPAHVTHDIAFIKKQNEAIEFLNRSLQLYDILYQDTMRKLNAGNHMNGNKNNSQSQQQNNRNRTHSGNLVNPMMMGPRVMTPTSIVNGRSVMSSPTFHNPICRVFIFILGVGLRFLLLKLILIQNKLINPKNQVIKNKFFCWFFSNKKSKSPTFCLSDNNNVQII